MKPIHSVLPVAALLAAGSLAAACSDDDFYEHADDGRPEYEYLTTIPDEQFQHQAVGFCWKRTGTRFIDEEGYTDRDISHLVDPRLLGSLYFTVDSVTQFFYNGTDSVRQRLAYTYDERTNMLKSADLPYMQLSRLLSKEMRIVQLFYQVNGIDFYAEFIYERLLPMEMNEFWTNYQPLEP